jgi:phenylacetate-coenzyme A ligase PaaK-like adenylate-forming protein
VHVAEGHRLAWGECRESGAAGGLHTYPDLELLDVVDPDSGERASGADSPRELVLTQLGMRGTALLRWRTGDLVDDVTASACPGCGRTVPRVLGARRGALVPVLALRDGTRPVDLRAVSAALVGRTDLEDWRVVVRAGARDGRDQLLLHVAPARGVDVAEAAVAVADAVRATAGLLPTQVVRGAAGRLPSGGTALSGRMRIH